MGGQVGAVERSGAEEGSRVRVRVKLYILTCRLHNLARRTFLICVFGVPSPISYVYLRTHSYIRCIPSELLRGVVRIVVNCLLSFSQIVEPSPNPNPISLNSVGIAGIH